MPQKVTDPALLAALNGGPPAAPAVSAPSFPGVIQGRPKPAPTPTPPTPFQIEDQEAQRIKNERETLEWNATHNPDGTPKVVKDAATTEGERKASGFVIRAQGANDNFAKVQEIGPRSLIGQGIADSFPKVANQFSGSERQQMEQAQREFIASVLRLDSGAAIPPEEFVTNAQIYFPQPGDSEEVLKQKEGARFRAINSLRVQAGMEPLPEPAGLPEDGLTGITVTDDRPEGLVGNVSHDGSNPANGTAPPAPGADANGNSFLGSMGDLVEGAASLPGIIINPIGQATYDLTGYGDQTYDFGKIVREGLGLPRNPDGLLRNVNTFGAGAMTGGAAARGVAAITQPGTVNALAQTLGNSPIRDTVSGMGAGAGSYYGEKIGGTPGAIGGAIVGGLAAHGGANALTSSVRQPNASANALKRAGETEGVTVNRAMIDPRSANRVSGVDATMAGGPTVQQGMRTVERQIEGRVQRLGGDGKPLDDLATGDTVRQAGERFIKSSGEKAKVKYDRAERMAGDAKITPQESMRRVDEMIARLSETPGTNAKEIAHLQAIKKDLSKDLSVGGLRRMRTKLRKEISKGDLTFGEDEADVLAIMDGAAQDIRTGLAAQGKEGAANAFDAADKSYRARMEYINGTVQKLIGKRQDTRSAEDIARKFQSMTATDARGLRKFYATLEPDEAADVAATFAERVGKNNAGDFSVAHFISQTEKMSDHAIETIFGKEGAQSVRNRRVLGKEVKRVTGAMNSRTSKTAVANDYRSWLSNLLLGGGGGAGLQAISGSGATVGALAGGAAALGGKAVRDVLNARALMSPKITKWLTQAPRSADPKAINAHFDRLATLAKNEPALASEIKSLQDSIMRAANDNLPQAGRAAASPEQRPDDSDK